MSGLQDEFFSHINNPTEISDSVISSTASNTVVQKENNTNTSSRVGNRVFNAVCLSSGSVRGIFQLGALYAADFSGALNQVKYYAGTSVGAIISMLMAVGWHPIDIFTYICVNDFTKLLPNNLDIVNTFSKWGAVDPQPLKEFIKKMVLQKYGGCPTFKQLAKEGKIFVCPAYRLRHTHSNVYFSPETTPDMSVVDAVMLSSNIPFVFQSQTHQDDYYIDGAVFDHNPASFLSSYITKHHDETPSILNVSVHVRQEEQVTDTSNIDSQDGDDEKLAQLKQLTLMEYVKEIMMVALYSQQKVNSTDEIYRMDIHTGTTTWTSLPDKAEKIKWFCEGTEQALPHFK